MCGPVTQPRLQILRTGTKRHQAEGQPQWFAAEANHLPSVLPAVSSIEKLLPQLDSRSAAVMPASGFNSPLAMVSASEPVSGADGELDGLGVGVGDC